VAKPAVDRQKVHEINFNFRASTEQIDLFWTVNGMADRFCIPNRSVAISFNPLPSVLTDGMRISPPNGL